MSTCCSRCTDMSVSVTGRMEGGKERTWFEETANKQFFISLLDRAGSPMTKTTRMVRETGILRKTQGADHYLISAVMFPITLHRDLSSVYALGPFN